MATRCRLMPVGECPCLHLRRAGTDTPEMRAMSCHENPRLFNRSISLSNGFSVRSRSDWLCNVDHNPDGRVSHRVRMIESVPPGEGVTRRGPGTAIRSRSGAYFRWGPRVASPIQHPTRCSALFSLSGGAPRISRRPVRMLSHHAGERKVGISILPLSVLVLPPGCFGGGESISGFSPDGCADSSFTIDAAPCRARRRRTITKAPPPAVLACGGDRGPFQGAAVRLGPRRCYTGVHARGLDAPFCLREGQSKRDENDPGDNR